jgi:hypothetical protein
MKRILLSTVLALCALFLAGAQVLPSAETQGQPKEKVQRVQKRYNIFFRINSPEIDRTFQDNARTLD